LGQIRKKETYVIIYSEEEQDKINYCPRCLQSGLYHILQERIYLPDEIPDGILPRDHDLWKQCHEWGQIIPKYEAKKNHR
jgi:hypothetical protein